MADTNTKITGASVQKPTVNEDPTEPWKPAEILKVEAKAGYRRRWVRRDLVDRKLAEGWVLVNEKDLKVPATIIDGTQMGTSVQKRELVLMEMSEERAKKREAYFKSLTDSALVASAEEFKGVANEGTGRSYGEIKVIKG